MHYKQQHKPPKLILHFFHWYCHPDYQEDIEGDLRERFERRIIEDGVKKARWEFCKDVIRLFRPGIIRPIQENYPLNNYGMYQNYFKIAWRNLLRYRIYSFIKVGGLSIGIAACLLITLYMKDELSYDQHYPDNDRIYRVLFEYDFGGDPGFGIATQAPLAKTLMDEFPEVEEAGRLNPFSLFGAGSKEVRSPDSQHSIHEEHVTYFDQALLEVLQPVMLEGNLHQALAEPNTVVISKSKADIYFPEENALGKTLIFNEDEENPYKIGGVMEDFPDNSHLNYDFLMTLTGREFWENEQQSWGPTNYLTYVKLKPNTDAGYFEAKMATLLEKYCVPVLSEYTNTTPESVKKHFKFHLQPITDIHLKSTHTDDIMTNGDIKLVRLFGAIAGFILLLACINFINLSTAKSANRAKEVGLRKTLGSFRTHLVQQFLSESVLFSVIAFFLGILLAWLFLPYFNTLAAKSLIFPWGEWWFVASVPLLALLVGIVSGIYPAFYLSAFKPVQVLKGNISRGGWRSGSKNAKLRNGLVVFQFSISIILIIGTLVINRQINFILNTKIGFEKEQVILLQGAHTLGDQVTSLKNEILRLSEVENVSVSDYLPITGNEVKRNGTSFWKDGKKEEGIAMGQLWAVDEDYVQTMGMKILKGRDFSEDKGHNRGKVIINKTLAQKLGLDNPIGQLIQKNGGDGGNTIEIIGVVEDFHFQSFKEDIGGLCLIIGNSPFVVSVKARTQDMPQLLHSIENIWDKFSPKQPIRYNFLDERFAMMYGDVQRTGSVFFTFAILAIMVACLGLFALSAFMAEQRSKEMSIRKILGASVRSIFRLLTFNFLKLVLIALLMAGPIAWYLMQKWLEDFAYKIDLAWWFFGSAGAIVVGIALITISAQALKVSLANPVDSLKNE